MSGETLGADPLRLLVAAKQEVARETWLFDLRDPEGAELPPFEPGAHLVVENSGRVGAPILDLLRAVRTHALPDRREARKGRARRLGQHDRRRPQKGDILRVSRPVNYFPLDPAAGKSLLIAGGIGITPILAMARHLREQGSPFRIVYCARSADAAAFVDVLTAPEFADRTAIHYDGGDPAQGLDFGQRLRDYKEGAHLYCCGPRGLMTAVREATRHWPAGTVHFEDFGTSDHPGGAEGEFRVRLARSGDVVAVGAEESILDALRRHGLDVPSSCEAGTCGSCRMTLLAGEVDHRDFVLDEHEYSSAIMICVSRALSEELTLDA